MKKFLAILTLVSCVALSAVAADLNPVFDLQPFRDGDIVVNAGDSITHTGRFSSYLLTFYVLRYPDRKVEFFNAGIGGGTASSVDRRIDWDIAIHKPTVVTVMVGMNDSRRNLYLEDKKGPDIEKTRKKIVQDFKDNLAKMVDDLREQTSAKIILLTPSPYDQTVELSRPNNYASNDVLGHLSDYLFHFAAMDNRVKLVDFHNPMNRINESVQQTEPTFTLSGGDRMHPPDLGHLVMAQLFLSAQRVNPVVYDVEINAAEQRIVHANHANVTPPTASPTSVAFSLTADSLPFALRDDWKRVLELVPFAETLNRSSLKIVGIPDGTWRLAIDGEEIGTYSKDDLAKGIDLAFNDKTPSYKQAREVVDLGSDWFSITRKLRNAAYGERTMRGKKVDMTDETAVKETVDRITENPKTRGYVKSFLKDFMEVREKRAEMDAEIARIENEMRAKAKPKSHRYELTRMP